jgi:hypothetical protein
MIPQMTEATVTVNATSVGATAPEAKNLAQQRPNKITEIVPWISRFGGG